jgi:hypothetical protein
VTIRRTTVLAMLAMGVVAMVAAACDAVFSIHELDGTVDFGTAACSTCAYANCRSESAACVSDKVVCAPYENCLARCAGEPGCRSQCTISNRFPASPAISALSACLTTNCESACGLTCGAFGGYLAEPNAAPACQSCLQNQACSDSRTCASSADCDGYWRCYMACTTPDCKLACADNDAGVSIFRPLQQDYSGICATPCAFGNYWACVGQVSWPVATSPAVDFTVPVIDFITDKPVPGESVSICKSCPCGTTVTPDLADTATTDDAGLVTLHVQQLLNSSGVGLNGCVQVTSPDGQTVPYFGYWGYPLTEAQVSPLNGPGSRTANLVAQSVQTFTPAELAAATSSYAGVTQLPGRGEIGAAVFDCLDNPSPGVRVTIDTSDPEVVTYYGAGDAGATNSVGLAAFYNVPLGNPVTQVTVTAWPDALDGAASSVETVTVAADTTTAVGMVPTPSGATSPH